LLLDGLVGVDPPGDALLVRVLEAEVVCLHDVQLAENDLQQFAAQRSALKQCIFVFYTIQVNPARRIRIQSTTYKPVQYVPIGLVGMFL
jgi:hypothetical protein